MRRRFLNAWIIVFLLTFFGMNLSRDFLQIEKHFGKDELLLPRKIIVSNKRIIILDEYGDMTPGDERIKIFSEKGALIREFGNGGNGPGEFGQAIAIYIFSQKIYILDSFKRQIHVFLEGDSNKFLKSEKISSGSSGKPFTTPDNFLISSDGAIYYNSGVFIKGQQIITKLTASERNELKIETQFLDCIPVYSNQKEMYLRLRTKANRPEVIRSHYWNNGYIAALGKKIYFSNWLYNNVYEFSMGGILLKKYTLPLKSINQTVKVIQMGNFYTIEKKLNYDLISRNARIYVLSCNEMGNSVVFELKNGSFYEKCSMKEELFSFDISGNKIYGITREEPEIFVYKLDE